MISFLKNWLFLLLLFPLQIRPMSYTPNDLIRAIQDGDSETVALLLEEGTDPNIQDSAGRLPVVEAVKLLQYPDNLLGRRMILQLVNSGADVNAPDDSGATALTMAQALSVPIAIINYLKNSHVVPLEHDAEAVLPISPRLRIPSNESVGSDDYETRLAWDEDGGGGGGGGGGGQVFDDGGVAEMKEIAASLDSDLLIFAVQDNDLEQVRLLLATGVNPNTKNVNGVLPLVEAIDLGRILITKELLNNGAMVTPLDSKGQSALSMIVSDKDRINAALSDETTSNDMLAIIDTIHQRANEEDSIDIARADAVDRCSRMAREFLPLTVACMVLLGIGHWLQK